MKNTSGSATPLLHHPTQQSKQLIDIPRSNIPGGIGVNLEGKEGWEAEGVH